MKLFRTEIDRMDCSKELFMMTYMDLNHVPVIHRGLNSWVDVRKAEFKFSPESSIQYAPFNGSPKQGKYAEYYKRWLEYSEGADPIYGAVWECVYPYSMTERYPGLLVQSRIDGNCINTLDFYDITGNQSLTQAAIESYMETAEEDKVATENLEWDRRYNVQGMGTFHPILSSGISKWKEFMIKVSK